MLNKKILLFLLLLSLLGCAPALPKTVEGEALEAKVSADVIRAADRAENSSRTCEQRLAEARQLHSEVKAMLEESRKARAECAAIAKRITARRAAARKAQAKKVEAKKTEEQKSEYSPSDAPTDQ